MVKLSMYPDNPQFPPQSEIPQPTSFEQALYKLSGPIELRQPLTLESLDPQSVRNIREVLTRSGANLNKPSPETLASLFDPIKIQFRDLDHQRGIAIRNIFGPQRAQQIIDEIPQMFPDAPKIISSKTKLPIEGTQGRALRHFLVLLCGVALDPQKTEEVAREINTRSISSVYGKLTQEKQELFNPHIEVDWLVNKRNHSSFPKDSLPKFWNFLNTGQITDK